MLFVSLIFMLLLLLTTTTTTQTIHGFSIGERTTITSRRITSTTTRTGPITTTNSVAAIPRTTITRSQQQQQHLAAAAILRRRRNKEESSTKLYGFLADLLGQQKNKIVVEEQPEFEPVTIEPDFRVAGIFLLLGLFLDLIPYIQLTLGPIVTLLGILFLVQTFRIRFVFDEKNAFTLKVGDELKESGENVIVGGENCWDCNTIVNYDFFPKGWIDKYPAIGPILVYFKETQTPETTWNDGPGKMANDPTMIESGQAIAGQVHFFPAVCNAQQIRKEFEKRGCKKL